MAKHDDDEFCLHCALFELIETEFAAHPDLAACDVAVAIGQVLGTLYRSAPSEQSRAHCQEWFEEGLAAGERGAVNRMPKDDAPGHGGEAELDPNCLHCRIVQAIVDFDDDRDGEVCVHHVLSCLMMAIGDIVAAIPDENARALTRAAILRALPSSLRGPTASDLPPADGVLN